MGLTTLHSRFSDGGFYQFWLVVFALLCLTLLCVERYVTGKGKDKSKESADDRLESARPACSGSALGILAKKYLVVYAIVMAADWLQGPYIYSLYREQYGFPERMVALFFVTGFVSGGMAAPLVGAWADQHGRKKLCLAFCLSYFSTCVLSLFPILPVLLVGRLCGGISGSILYSAFESWLISSASSVGLSNGDLSTILGRATLVNGFVATGAGVFSNKLVATTHNFASPMVASGCLLVVGFLVIRATWSENYGTLDGSPTKDLWQTKRLSHAWKIAYNDPMLLTLGLMQTCFEGSMYLFVFVWVPSLQEATHSPDALPLGYIFSSFMISIMIGSIFYNLIATYTKRNEVDSSLTTHAKLSSLVCALSSLAFAACVSSKSEQVRFFAFCAFEACVGVYYPAQGMLRGTLISNEHRATLSSLFRVPLNIFVVISLMTGVSSARQAVLSACATILGFSSLMAGFYLVGKSEEVAVGNGAARP
ncbi:hypothetical protein AGABI1DRAFT_116460 [Agaricus bisporus var. burnettii JB137-S8]|uniref:Molybdate-anion transporter n=1 Tax=Agaricus bisporus var. burnettii (strain JB137-S8 / ATCC MYA-4627 / FGSC 10392) TaxID=597362 RepID=K5WXN5_AGABU|nr:uncharacterized protein AGABI1DRAFT_116460 [Agaricus bisporus var. burnettii JB137-S8]EKM75352.1 hypothetical protein AGABI1DRAFT_116460 [Agaricus bisporus var. burnettii JB137-S8]